MLTHWHLNRHSAKKSRGGTMLAASRRVHAGQIPDVVARESNPGSSPKFWWNSSWLELAADDPWSDQFPKRALDGPGSRVGKGCIAHNKQSRTMKGENWKRKKEKQREVDKETKKGPEITSKKKTRPDKRHKMRLVCVLITFENNTGRTDGRMDLRTDGRTDGHDLL